MRSDGHVVCFGELLIRLAAPGAELLLQTPHLEAAFGGAEANVAVGLARLGHDVRMLSVVPDNALGRAARDELRRYEVDVGGVSFAPGRMGLYFLTPGIGPRAAEIVYDRAASAFAEYALDAIDWSAALAGAGWLHVSGVTAALGPKAAQSVLNAARAARSAGVTVSFDCNYRAKLWEAWRGDGPKLLGEILAEADLVFGDHRDIGLILGKAFAPGRDAADAAFAAFPRLQRLAATARTQHSASHHDLAASMFARDAQWNAPAASLAQIVDRIGAGDAFAAGLIHGLRRGKGDEAALKLGLAAGCLKHVTPGDFGLAREADLEAVIAGELAVRR
ncbi:2-dehydro-3-deoxygluconate kinase [alpha proteobacterium U9-1i]|nr:2-dehydro-3-deoxygluconate kinase [alpha proteobacterium U9-1i]